jgi:hypothetical protein
LDLMSDMFLRIIPADPKWIPLKENQERAAEHLRNLIDRNLKIDHRVFEAVTFIDCGDGLERITCPVSACHSSLPFDWWQEELDSAAETQFEDLGITVPCCKFPTSLNELEYDPPVGFARFCLEVLNPGIKKLEFEVRNLLARDLERPVRVIFAHF